MLQKNKKLDKEVRLLLGPAKNNIQRHNEHRMLFSPKIEFLKGQGKGNGKY